MGARCFVSSHISPRFYCFHLNKGLVPLSQHTSIIQIIYSQCFKHFFLVHLQQKSGILYWSEFYISPFKNIFSSGDPAAFFSWGHWQGEPEQGQVFSWISMGLRACWPAPIFLSYIHSSCLKEAWQNCTFFFLQITWKVLCLTNTGSVDFRTTSTNCLAAISYVWEYV